MKHPYTIRVDRVWLTESRAKTPHLDHLSLSDWLVAMTSQSLNQATQQEKPNAINDQPATTQSTTEPDEY